MENQENRRAVFDITFQSDHEESDDPASDIEESERNEDSESDLDLDNGSSDSSSESEEEIEIPQAQNGDRWSFNDRSDVQKQPFIGPEPGPTTVLDRDATEGDFFGLFFPDFLIEMIVLQTNLYASQKQRVKRDPHWRPVTEEEVRAWLGIRIYMSILFLPQTPMYWSNDRLFGKLSIRKIMKRDRFDKITQYIHLSDRTLNPPRGQPGHDKLHHVRPILDEVLRLCKERYNAHQNTSVDEAMVKFRGRLSFRQYLPAKPTKYGVKVWMRADPANGYVNEFQVYTGKEGNNVEVGLAARVVEDLTRSIWNRHHIVNVDNYFTSPVLFDRLLQQQTYARGTVRSNRKGFPVQQLKPKDIKEQGQFNTAQKGEMTATVWKDKKPIFCLSTAENPRTIVSSVARKSRNGEVRDIPAPSIIPEYNNNMNGVDHADQLRTEYSTYRTSRKWWLYVFWFLFDTAVTNGFILMRESPNHQRQTRSGKAKPRTMLEFRCALAKLLIGDFVENRRAAMATVSNGHYPQMMKKRGRCRQCSKNNKRSTIQNKCKQCDIFLCVNCFQAYHADLVKNK